MAACWYVVDRAIPEEAQASWAPSRLVPLGCDRVVGARSGSGRCGARAGDVLLCAKAVPASGVAIGMLPPPECAATVRAHSWQSECLSITSELNGEISVMIDLGTSRQPALSSTVTAEPSYLPDLAQWEQRPATQLVPEKSAAACPYIGGSERRPRDTRTLRRWRVARRGPPFRKIGGRYFYTVGALRDFYERSVRGDQI